VSSRAKGWLAIPLLLVLVAACSNSKSQQAAEGAVQPKGKVSPTTANASELRTNVPRNGVKGVTPTTIRVAVITSKTNPTGTRFHAFIDGVHAYFDMVNRAGGIYGRKLDVVADRDDIVGVENSQQITTSLADDNAFATLLSTAQFTGADLLAQAHQPTFIWNINPEFASTPTSDHSNIFGSDGAQCFKCLGPLLSWIAEQNHFTRVGIIGYGVNAEAKTCAQGNRSDLAHYTHGAVKAAFYDDTLPFAADLAADVARMKSAGVQLVTTCTDFNEVIKLAKEMRKQGLHAPINVLNMYEHDLLGTDGALLDGDYVWVQYPAWESQPQSPATQQFLTNIKQVTNDPSEISELGWIAATELVDALKGAGPQFTQQKVIDWMNAQTAYSAGGLIHTVNWSTGHMDPQRNPQVRRPLECQSVVRIEHSKFVAVSTAPGKPWVCLDINKDASQPVIFKSFAPGGVG
jgi:ABC-type branched-subunit amino acid transport system substrate-binding protein